MVYMDSSAGQHKEMGGNSLENMLVCSKQNNQQQQENRKARPQQEEALKCPRCDSINTKFCYYNNYSLTQPRYFCKSCRRYWTKGGTLRNVPVGGGCRKNKRSSSSSSISSNSSSTSSSSSLLRKPQIDHLINSSSNPSLLSSLIPPNLTYDSNDLTLAFARLHQKHSNGQHLGFHDDDQNQNQNHDLSILGNPNGSSFLGFLENQNNFQNGFYGYDNHNGEIMENHHHHHHHHHHMVLPNYDQHRDQDYVSSSTSSPATTTTTSAAAQILGVSNVTTMKQELICNNNYGREIDDDQSKILWGFPWQNINGNGSINSDFDSAGIREISSTWSNIHGGISSNWHGVLNTPLM